MHRILPRGLAPRRVSASAPRGLLTWALGCAAALLLAASASARSWEPIAPADLAATESKSAPGADLEYLLVHFTLNGADNANAFSSEGGTLWLEHHVRAKIYTQKGCDRRSLFKFGYNPRTPVREIAARVVKPDGSEVEVGKKDIFETTTFKKGGTEERVVSFALPNLSPGDVVEFRYVRVLAHSDYSYLTFDCQQEEPVREFTFNVLRALSDWNALWFNLKDAETKPGRSVTFRNLPAFRPENDMPAERDFRGWMVCVFSHPYFRQHSADDVWQDIGSYYADAFKAASKPTSELKARAEAIVAGASSEEEKLTRIYDYCQTEVSNLDWFETPELLAAEEKRNKSEHAQSAKTTLQLKTGNTEDINLLFAGLARAAGYEVRRALHADRDVLGLVRSPRGWLFMNRHSVAVKRGETWTFYSPGHYTVPAGLLSIRDVPVTTWICDSNKSFFQSTSAARADDSPALRKGRFTLDEEGTLEGEVEVSYAGHPAVELKGRWWGKPIQDANDFERDALTQRLPGAEISDMTWENLSSRAMPVIQRYKVRVPGYAEVAGTRLILGPSFFQRGIGPRYTAEARAFPIVFDYALRQSDDVEIVLPEGYTLDGGTAPANVADPQGIIAATYSLRYKGKARTLIYRRDVSVGGSGNIAFDAVSYPILRGLFAGIARSDDHRLVFKPTPAPAADGTTPAGQAGATTGGSK